MELIVKTSKREYPILIERGCLSHINDYINTNRKVLIITDEGVPNSYLETVKKQCTEVYQYVAKDGEQSKQLNVYENIIEKLLDYNFSRKDLIIGLGGGVIGDLSGFVAATYMRGIDFVNIPTTTLSQIDSSIGGKVGLNVNNTKNIVGSFYPPMAVLIDTNTLETLSTRHYNNGLVEALKAGLIYDESLFKLFETDFNIDEVIYKSLLVKKAVVEEDEFEQGIRKILNFGHTLGHGFESYGNLKELYHGEAVGIGMLKMINDDVIRNRLIKIYHKLNLPTNVKYNTETVYNYIKKDKKSYSNYVTIVLIDKIGKAILKDIEIEEIRKYLED